MTLFVLQARSRVSRLLSDSFRRGGERMDDFAGMLCHLCKRPGMYTMTGTFRELVAFLTGYDHARGLTIGMGCVNSEMYRFGEWLQMRSGITQSMPWMQALLLICNNDEERALRELWPMFEEFLAAPQYDRAKM
jgi:hypothetical protein